MADEIIAQSARDAGFPELKDQKEAINKGFSGRKRYICFITNSLWEICDLPSYAILPFVFDRMKGTFIV